jgi:hypothetical protein
VTQKSIEVDPGEEVVYRLYISNDSDSKSTPSGTKIYDTYDKDKLTITWMSPECSNNPNYSTTKGLITCKGIDLSPGETYTFDFVANVSNDATGTINNDDSSGFFSDKRLKTDIKPLEDSLQHIEQINGVKFYWKDKKRFGSQKEIGVIAQDVEKVYPQIVTTDKDGYKKVNYQLLVAPLIEAVKELKKENEQLKQRVEKLENR